MGNQKQNKITFAYYGLFDKPYRTEVYIAEALRKAGYRVIEKNPSDKKATIQCNYFLCSKLKTTDLLIDAKKKGIPTISWSFDLYRGYKKIKPAQYNADIVITTDGGDEYNTIRQGVCSKEKKMIRGKLIHDLVFVGSQYYNERREMIKRTGARVFNNIRGIPLNELLGKSKIVLGDSYPADKYWSNRIYEMTGRGGFLIHPKTQGLYDYIPQFERGKEKELIQYYLKHEDEREDLRKEQFKKCPTYDDRIKELVKLLGL